MKYTELNEHFKDVIWGNLRANYHLSEVKEMLSTAEVLEDETSVRIIYDNGCEDRYNKVITIELEEK